MKKPQILELDVEQLQAHLEQIEQTLGEPTARPFRMLLNGYLSLVQLIEQKNTSIGRLRRLLFGARTERTGQAAPSETAVGSETAAGEFSAGEPAGLETAAGESSSGEPSSGAAGRRRRPQVGHGRIPAQAYTGCEQVLVTHASFRPGDSCPHCQEGTLYRQQDWSPVVRLKGQPPVGGVRYELERLRCGLCGKIHTAELPEEAGPVKHDATVASIVATLRYGQGVPWTRIEQMQRAAGVPLPASVQWEVVRDAVERGPGAVYQQLLWEAAQGELLHNDDTRMRVLELTARLHQGQPLREDAPQRSGVFTTSILSLAEGRPTIALFFTGPRHSGENLRQVLARRLADLPPPLQMCDALACNLPGELQTVVAHCLSHGRRNFYELAEVFPAEVQHVLECLQQVYRTDGQAQKERLSPEERLRLHQQQSGPVMERLHSWLQDQLDQRRVEPNSSLGKAIAYLLNYWEQLTLFLREPGAPLDNNVCERALKMAIRHRKNSLFYQTLRGAQVGDVYMSLIHTCHLAHVDPFVYLTELQRNHERVNEHPAAWLPWNYRRQLDSG